MFFLFTFQYKKCVNWLFFETFSENIGIPYQKKCDEKGGIRVYKSVEFRSPKDRWNFCLNIHQNNEKVNNKQNDLMKSSIFRSAYAVQICNLFTIPLFAV